MFTCLLVVSLFMLFRLPPLPQESTVHYLFMVDFLKKFYVTWWFLFLWEKFWEQLLLITDFLLYLVYWVLFFLIILIIFLFPLCSWLIWSKLCFLCKIQCHVDNNIGCCSLYYVHPLVCFLLVLIFWHLKLSNLLTNSKYICITCSFYYKLTQISESKQHNLLFYNSGYQESKMVLEC